MALGIAAVPVMGYAVFSLVGIVLDRQDDSAWSRQREEIVAAYEDRTAEEVMVAGGAWAFGEGWPYPLPEGVQIIGVDGGPAESEVVFASAALASERCLQVLFDRSGIRTERETSCRAYRVSGGT